MEASKNRTAQLTPSCSSVSSTSGPLGAGSRSRVATAARVLREFGKGDTQLGVSELARRIGVGKSTAHRVVWTLVQEQLLEKVEDTGLFRLTPTMRNLGVSAETALSLHQAATGPLDQLRSVTDHTLHVAILDGTDVLYVERRESPTAMAVFSRVGGRNAAYLTSTGKVLLAFLDSEEQERLVASMRLTRRTPFTITTRSALLAELSPVRGRTGRVVAAVSVAGHAAEDPDTIRRLTRPVVETAGRISHNLGWRRPGHGDQR